MSSEETLFKRNDNVVVHKVIDQFLFVPIEDNVLNSECVYTTNRIGARIWELLDGSTSISAVAKVLVSEYETDEATALRDVIGFVEAMRAKGCVEEYRPLQPDDTSG